MSNSLRIFTRSLLLSAVLLGVAASGALAQAHLNARFALHAKDHFTASKDIPNLCPDLVPSDGITGSYDPNYEGIDCRDYAVVRPVGEFPGPHVYLVVGQADPGGLSGASCGIDYTVGGSTGISETFTNFTSCTDGLEFRNSGDFGEFPNPGGGLRITWSSCQTSVINGNGVHAVLGVFYVYVYSEDVLQLTANENLDSGAELAVTACAGGTTNFLSIIAPSLLPLALGRVHFGGDGMQGYTPCGVIPTRATTWGKLKNMYQEQKP